MTLHEFECVLPPPDRDPIPAEVRRFAARAEERIESYLRDRRHRELGGFVTSDPLLAYRCLRHIMDERLAPNETFLEWGCGFGVVAGMAALLEYDAYGIEVQSELVEEARMLAESCELPVEIAMGTFGEESRLQGTIAAGWDIAAPNGYVELELDPADVGVTYAYPWPGEESVYLALFESIAPLGALLVLHSGSAGNRLFRR